MTSTPKVSVIMPVFNAEKFIGEAVESILRQTFTDFEFIIINDASTDGSRKIIKTFSDKRIILVNNPHQLRITASLNKAIGMAKGDYIARMDADDVSLSDRLETQVKFLDNHQDVGVVGSWVEVFGRRRGVWKYPTDPKVIRGSQLFNGSIVHPAVMIRKSFLDKFHLRYNENYPNAQDYELWSRCAGYFKLANIGKVLLKYRLHESQEGTKFSQARAKLVEQIRRRELTLAGLEFTPEEFAVHNQIASNQFPSNSRFINLAEKWLTKIQRQLTDPVMAKVLENYWFLTCQHYGAWQEYLRSSLSRRGGKYFKHLVLVFLASAKGRQQPKLLYILPEYNPDLPTHYVHLYEFLEELAKDTDVFLLIEKASRRPEFKNIPRIRVEESLPGRLKVIILARLLGYDRAYVHYSYAGAILASLVFRPTLGKVFYWHCEVYNNFSGQWLLRLAIKMTTYLVTGTKRVGDFYVRQFSLHENKIKIVPNWVNLSRLEVGKRAHRHKIVLFAHKLVPRKGADLLPEIIARVSKEIPEVKFIILGPGDKETLAKAIRIRKLSGKVKLVGAVPNKQIVQYFAGADVFIMPSRQEGFPRVLLEAMACGVPFVATDAGGTLDILSEGQKKYVVPVGDTELFCRLVCDLLKNESKRQELIVEGKSQVQNYDLGKVLKIFKYETYLHC